MVTQHITVRLDKEATQRLVRLAQALGYTHSYAGTEVGNLTALMQAIADGRVELITMHHPASAQDADKNAREGV